MHCLGSAPWYLHLLGNFRPHFGFEPLVKSRELVFALFIPLAAALEIILVVETAADGAAAGKALGDVVPFHATAAKLYD